jgi:hypothetical protein
VSHGAKAVRKGLKVMKKIGVLHKKVAPVLPVLKSIGLGAEGVQNYQDAKHKGHKHPVYSAGVKTGLHMACSSVGFFVGAPVGAVGGAVTAIPAAIATEVSFAALSWVGGVITAGGIVTEGILPAGFAFVMGLGVMMIGGVRGGINGYSKAKDYCTQKADNAVEWGFAPARK